MKFELEEDHQMIKDLVRKFVASELMPHEPACLQRAANGQGLAMPKDVLAKVDARSRELGLWGLDAPEDVGGQNLPTVAMIGVNEELAKTVIPYVLPPDSPNLSMLVATVNEKQRVEYLEPYVRGETFSAIAISEPGAGADPSGMMTTAVRDGDEWVINGRKIWISRMDEADYAIVLAVTEKRQNARNAISAFIVDKDTPGFNIIRPIPMVGGTNTFEIAFDDCRIPADRLLGKEGEGFASMQTRLGTRRIEMASWSIGMAQRSLDMMLEYAPLRTTFGHPLSQRQTVQNWVADAAMKIHAARLMTYDCAWKMDSGRDVKQEISMIKSYAVEMAYEVVDHAMQLFGAMGMTKEMPLAHFSEKLRTMRIFDGPTEIHNWVVARGLFGTRSRG